MRGDLAVARDLCDVALAEQAANHAGPVRYRQVQRSSNTPRKPLPKTSEQQDSSGRGPRSPAPTAWNPRLSRPRGDLLPQTFHRVATAITASGQTRLSRAGRPLCRRTTPIGGAALEPDGHVRGPKRDVGQPGWRCRRLAECEEVGSKIDREHLSPTGQPFRPRVSHWHQHPAHTSRTHSLVAGDPARRPSHLRGHHVDVATRCVDDFGQRMCGHDARPCFRSWLSINQRRQRKSQVSW